MSSGDRWLGLEKVGPGRWDFELTPGLTRFDAKLYGGTGLAVVTALLEAETGRDALWATTQFVATADLGEHIDCRVEVLAEGRRTSQLRITATVGDRLVLAALGAAGSARGDGLAHQVGAMPDVAGPEDLPPWSPRVPFVIPEDHRGWLATADLREVEMGDGPDRTTLLWGRIAGQPLTRAGLSFLADVVPSAVVRAAGHVGGGRSLDNAIRFGSAPDTEWVLIQMDPHLAFGGYVHGAAHLWSQDGRRLGIASQTAVALLLD
jgi:acyl-CoA thioesterase